MMLRTILLNNKSHILERWFNLIIETYPPDTGRQLRIEKDRFSNPVGYTISEGISILFDVLVDEKDSDSAASALDSIMRIRAVQDLSPSRATNIIPLLRRVITEVVNGTTHRGKEEENGLPNELLNLYGKLDIMHSLACDFYTKCKEEIHAIQLKEMKLENERAQRLLKFTQNKCL